MKPCTTMKWARRLAAWMVALILCTPFQYPVQQKSRILGLSPAQAAEDPRDSEIAALRQRVQALEEQNRQILELLRGIQRPPEAPAPTAVIEGPVQGKEAPIRWGDLLPMGSRLKLYGSLRMDSDWDSAPTNDIRLSQWVRSSDRAAGGKDQDSSFALHPRLTRFGLDFQGLKLERLWDGAVSGKLETDFHNGGSDQTSGVASARGSTRPRGPKGSGPKGAGGSWSSRPPTSTRRPSASAWTTPSMATSRPGPGPATRPSGWPIALSWAGE